VPVSGLFLSCYCIRSTISVRKEISKTRQGSIQARQSPTIDWNKATAGKAVNSLGQTRHDHNESAAQAQSWQQGR